MVVALLFIVAGLNYLDRAMLTTMHASLVAAIPMNDTEFGLVTSVFLWSYACMGPLGGFLADRVSRSRIIIGSLILWSGFTWLTAHVTTLPELLATRALMGISEACYIPAGLALIADYHRGPTRSLATGIHMIGISLGEGLGGMGGFLADHYNWTYAFRLFGGVGLVYSIVLILFLRDVPAAEAGAEHCAEPPVRFDEALRSLFGSPSFWVALLYWGLVAIASWAVAGWLPTMLGERFHLSQGTAGFSATGYIQPAVWVGLIVGGAWSDRASRRNPRGRVLVTIAGLCIAAPALYFGVSATTLAMAVTGFVVWAFGMAFVNANMMPILCLIANPRYRATGYGILNLLSCLVGGLTIFLGGALRDSHIDVGVIFNGAVFVTLFCGALLLLIKPTAHAS